MSANYTWIASTGGDWSVASDWAGGVPNSANAIVAISLAGTYTVTIGASESFSVSSLAITAPGANLQLDGTLTVTQTLTLAAGSIYFDGTIDGGTIVAKGSGLSFQGGTLDGVTYQGALNLGASLYAPTLTVVGGLVLTGTGGIGPGSILDTGALGSTITFDNTQTLDNATVSIGTITSATDALFENDTTSTPQTLTFGPNLVINQTGRYAQVGTLGSGGS